MHIESTEHVAGAKFDSVNASSVDFVADVKIAFEYKVKFDYGIQLFLYDLSSLKLPWLQRLNKHGDEGLVIRIIIVIIRKLPKLVKTQCFVMAWIVWVFRLESLGFGTVDSLADELTLIRELKSQYLSEVV